MYGNARNETRQQFFTAWKKFKSEQILTDFEQQLIQVIIDHPEYHYIFDNPEKYDQQEYFPELGETNPYAHLGIHLALRDQISTDLPPGIRALYFEALTKYGNDLEVEHLMLEVLALELWEALQSQSNEFNVENYMEGLKQKLK